MGLAIRYHSNLVKARGNEAFDETGEIKDGWVQIWVNTDFPGREDRLEDRRCYSAESSEYFYAAGYAHYGSWREMLAKLAGYPAVDFDKFGDGRLEKRHAAGAWGAGSGPFWELIQFSDCEGIIGPETSKKLADDFARFQERADQIGDVWFLGLYAKFRKAFETASENGAVEFC